MARYGRCWVRHAPESHSTHSDRGCRPLRDSFTLPEGWLQQICGCSEETGKYSLYTRARWYDIWEPTYVTVMPTQKSHACLSERRQALKGPHEQHLVACYSSAVKTPPSSTKIRHLLSLVHQSDTTNTHFWFSNSQVFCQGLGHLTHPQQQ